MAKQHPRTRGLARVDRLLEQMDPGAESPQETYLRLTVIEGGFPRPCTQIPVRRPDGRRYYLDMGWPELMIAAEYDGEHHRTDRGSFTSDVERSQYLADAGWIVIRVLADHRRADILTRIERAFGRRSTRAAG